MMLYDLMGSDCIVNKNYGSSPEPIYEFSPSRTMSTGDAHYIWETMYKAINEANIIIANVDNVSGSHSDKAALKGQALAIRAFCYFHLLLNYQQTYAIARNKRGVILRLSPDDNADKGFSTVEECYDQVVKDLTEAETALASFKRSEKWQACPASLLLRHPVRLDDFEPLTKSCAEFPQKTQNHYICIEHFTVAY